MLAPIIMRESDSLHKICADTGLSYMNDCTRDIIRLVKEVNEAAGEYIMAYTVDAGANCFIICQQDHMERVFAGFQSVLNLSNDFLNERA